MTKINSYRNLIVWQKEMELVKFIYAFTYKYPNEPSEIEKMLNSLINKFSAKK